MIGQAVTSARGHRLTRQALFSFLRQQQLYLAIAATIYAIFWALGLPMNPIVTLIYSLLLGNMGEIFLGRVQRELQEQELQRAREIQRALTPEVIPQVPGFEVAGAWEPARVVGGDYFDV